MHQEPILLVEDNEDDAELVMLAMRGISARRPLVVARDGDEALEYLLGPGAQPGQRPWLVLLDLKLRRVGGLETLASLRADERTRRLPVVILSSSNEERDVTASYDLGANSYIRKPHGFEELSSTLEKVLDYWSVNEVAPA